MKYPVIRLFLSVILIINIGITVLFAQSNFSKFKKLSGAEKCWVLTHPFIAKRTLKITQSVLLVTDSIRRSSVLDGDANGGQVDAFRHAYWMASVARQFGKHRALQLGKAHEKGNYRDYKKHRNENGVVPDKISSEMDLWNNALGADLGASCRKTDDLLIQQLIINAINDGMLKIIKKNKAGQFLDEKGMIISPESLKGKWVNNKCLVNSDYIIYNFN